LYTLLPFGAHHLNALHARTGERQAIQVVDRGTETTTIQGVSHPLRHVILHVGGEDRQLWYDARGRLMRVDIATSGLIAERAPGPP
jgi:hypothetical protein